MHCMQSSDIVASMYHIHAWHDIIMFISHSCVRRQERTSNLLPRTSHECLSLSCVLEYTVTYDLVCICIRAYM